MATSQPYSIQANPPAPSAPAPVIHLRVWPAAICLLLLASTRLVGYAFDELPTIFYQVLFMGPLAATLLTAIWWLGASRAALWDRLLAFVIIVAAGVGSFMAAHPTVHGMVFLFFVLPIAVAAFLITVLLLSRLDRSLTTWAAVFVTVLAFAGGLLVRNEGFSGDFKASFDWRWNANPEEQYLAQRKAQESQHKEKVAELGAIKWAGFRGANRDGVVPGVKLAEDWKANKPKELWRRKVGPGWSSFAAAGDLLFTQEQRGETEAVLCLDANTGADVWSFEYPSRFWEAVAGAGPRATPTLHEGALYTLGAQGILCKLEPLTGKLVWKRDLREDSKAKTPPMWGFTSSPLVTNGLVIVHAGATKPDTGSTLAFDAQTGEPRWTAPAGDHSYSSAQLSTIAGKPSILMATNTGLHAYDPATGTVLWDHEWPYKLYRVNQPLVLNDSSVLLATSMDAGTRRVEVTQDGKTSERWTSMAMKPGFNDFVAHNGCLYGFDLQMFACIDLETGAKKWKDGRYGNGQVLLLPDANQLLVTSEKGDIVLLRANPDKREELAKLPALSGKTWNHPILVGNRVYLRNGEEAACFELPAAK
jgi:outer membrane protein assembly factor BamB